MRGRALIVLAALAAAVCAAGCVFGPTSYKGVIGYRDGRVFLKHDSVYDVGRLPKGWKRMDSRARTISFYNPAYLSSISTDASCGGGVSDRRLDSLGGEVVSALEKRRLLSEEPFELDGRGALRQRVEGYQDGVMLIVDLVVVRKSGCVFDFYSVSQPEAAPQVAQDFEAFFSGFHYE